MKSSALILLSILFLALFLLGGDCGKGTIVEPADIDGIWRFYLSKSGESTETMLYINFIQSENYLIFFINPDENSNLYTDTITGNELSIAFNIGTDEILLSGTVVDDAMTGTWSDNTGDTGTFRAERGLDIGNASVVIPETGDILIEVEEENEIGSAIYYGTDEGDDGNPILTKCEFETDEGKCTIAIDEEQRVEEISIADLLISFSYPSGSAFNYEIWQNGDQVYSGDIFIGQTEEEIATKAPRPEENGFTRLGDRHSSLGIEDGDEDEVTFAEGIRYCAYGLLITLASVVTGEDDIEYDKEWMKHVYQETPVGELLVNYVVIKMIAQYRFQNRDKLCEDQKEYGKCIDRANVVLYFLNDYLTSIEMLVFNIIAKEDGIHDEQNCDDEKDNDGVRN